LNKSKKITIVLIGLIGLNRLIFYVC